MMTPSESEHAENLKLYLHAIAERVGALQQLLVILKQGTQELQDNTAAMLANQQDAGREAE